MTPGATLYRAGSLNSMSPKNAPEIDAESFHIRSNALKDITPDWDKHAFHPTTNALTWAWIVDHVWHQLPSEVLQWAKNMMRAAETDLQRGNPGPSSENCYRVFRVLEAGHASKAEVEKDIRSCKDSSAKSMIDELIKLGVTTVTEITRVLTLPLSRWGMLGLKRSRGKQGGGGRGDA